MPDVPEPEGLTLRDYLGVLWRRKWVIVLVLVVATASAYFFSARQPKQFAASTSLIYEANVDVADPLSASYVDTYALDREMKAIGDIIASPDMQRRAGKLLKEQGVTGGDYSVSSSVENADSSGSNTGSNVVAFSATSGSPQVAAKAADAYAQAFVGWRKERQLAQIAKAAQVVQMQLDDYPKAAHKTADYLMLKKQLQNLAISKATATGNYRVLVPATAPSVPFAPDPVRSALIGFGVGLFAGIGLAFLLEQFDTRLRSTDEIAYALRVPILGHIPRISKRELTEKTPVTLTHPDGHAAEAFRMVRTNLEFMNVDDATRSVLITSCVQGEGKSVAVANLAVSMALAGKKVVVVDADLRRPRQHQYFGLRNEVGLSTVVTGQTNLAQSLQPVEVTGAEQGQGPDDFAAWARSADASPRLFVLTSGPIPPNPGEIVAAKRFTATIERLQREADLVIVDTPAMLPVGDASAVARSVDGLVFLVEMHLAKRPQLAQAAEQLRRLPCRLVGTVVRADGARDGRYGYYGSGYYYGGYGEDGAKTKARDRRRNGRMVPKDKAPAAGPRGPRRLTDRRRAVRPPLLESRR